MNGANYSTTSDEMLCKTCKFGQVVESSSGGTAVICHCKLDGAESAVPMRLDILVTKCSRYELPQLLRLWDTAISMHMEDGHCWMDEQKYLPAIGHVHQRADTVGKPFWVFKEHPGRSWDVEAGHFVGDDKPIGHRIARWWRRLQS